MNIHNFLLKLRSIRYFIMINDYIHLYNFFKRENLEKNFNNYIHAICCIIFKLQLFNKCKNYEKNFNSMTWINKSNIWWKVDFESLKVKIYQIHFDNISLTIKSHVAKFFGIWRAAVWNGAKQNRSAVKVHKPCFFIYSRYLHYMLQPEVS